MDPVHREVLEDNFSYLENYLPGPEILNWLRTDDVINTYDYDQLRRTEPQGARAVNRLLVLTLQRSGAPHAYAALHRALREVGSDALCDVLLDTEMTLRDGLALDRLQRQQGLAAIHQQSKGMYSLQTAMTDLLTTSHTSSSDDQEQQSAAESAREKSTPSPSLSTKQQQQQQQQQQQLQQQQEIQKQADEEKEHRLQQLQQEVTEMRANHSKVEAELRHQLQQLEKDRDALVTKKGGGCVVM